MIAAVMAHARDELNIDLEELANPGQVSLLLHTLTAGRVAKHVSMLPDCGLPPSNRQGVLSQASITSAISFSLGAAIPLLAAAFIRDQQLRLVILCFCLSSPLLTLPSCVKPIICFSNFQHLHPWYTIPCIHMAHNGTTLRPFVSNKPQELLDQVSIFSASTVALLIFGAVGAGLGGASLWKGAARVAVGGWLALRVNWAAGKLFGGEGAP